MCHPSKNLHGKKATKKPVQKQAKAKKQAKKSPKKQAKMHPAQAFFLANEDVLY